MPRRKKKASELTIDEAMKKLFPKKVREELHRVAHERDVSDSKSSSQEDDIKEST